MKPIYWFAAIAIGFCITATVLAVGLDDGNQALKDKRYGDAYRLLLPEAEKGNSFAQYNIGYLLANGLGVKKDEKYARRWYELAAQQGDMDAQTNLGLMFQDGVGGERDFKQAALLFEKAARRGHALAQNNLGSAYLFGRGVNQDYSEALRWLTLSAEQGLAIAQNSLGGFTWKVVLASRRTRPKEQSGYSAPLIKVLNWLR